MNYNTNNDNSTHSINTRLETRFDQVFSCFQLRQENITEEDSVDSYLAENFKSFINSLDNKMLNGDIPNNTGKSCENTIEGCNISSNHEGSQAEAKYANQQLVDILKQQNEASLSYMQEIENLK
uniref:Uncharacterized protein n=1 Tax=Glossina palpalis gambiensis TaxID=67801 RepID=A0A1B0BZH3_9MUSC